MVDGVYPKEFICNKCKWSEEVITTEERYIECINDNTESSWPDYHDCKYYEEEE